jgi:hypothetical protein
LSILSALRFDAPLREGEWSMGSSDPEPDADDEPAALIVYAAEPSPETGDEGWRWWALGSMGSATTLRDAMRAAEDVLARKGGLA